MTFQFGSANKSDVDMFMNYMVGRGIEVWRDMIPGNPVSGYDDVWYLCFRADRETGYQIRKRWLKFLEEGC